MNGKQKPSLAGFVVACALAMSLGVGLFLLTHEQVTHTTEIGMNGRALRDPYLAARWILEELQIPVQPRYGLGELPPPDQGAVVVVFVEDPHERATIAEPLRAWVSAGGHLVAIPQGKPTPHFEEWLGEPPVPAPEGDLLYEQFGVTHTSGDEAYAWPFAAYTIEQSNDAWGTLNTVATLQRASLSAPGCASLVGHSTAENGDLWRQTLRADCVVDAGRVTLFGVSDFFTNENLRPERGDNANLWLDSLSTPMAPTEVILLLRGEDVPSFFMLLGRRAWPLFLSIAVSIFAWASFAGQRFGPVRTAVVARRRSWLEHLVASGTLLWRAGRTDALLSPMRAAVRRRLTRRLPHIAHLHGDALVATVSAATGHPPASIRSALVDTAPRDRSAFVAVVQALHQLWRAA